MGVIMEHAYQETQNGNVDLKESVRCMGTIFLNSIETSKEGAACCVLQLPITSMNKKVLFLHTTHTDESTLLLKMMKLYNKLT